MSLFRTRMPGARKSAQGGAHASPFNAPLAPGGRFFAIGDIHGQIDALEAVLSRLEDLGEVPQVICVGDYIDRGEHSAQVLSWLKRLTEEFGPSFVCLRGNHEEMLLRFLEDPDTQGSRWLRYGGLQTLGSYGIGRADTPSDRALRDALERAMGSAMIEWLADLPLIWQSGNVAVVHAAADPRVPINAQDRQVLQWGHPEFETVPRSDGVWVVHGHTIVDQPSAEAGRISIDTGAYATGKLTAAEISDEGVRFLSSDAP